mgnify:CR=1 FL=1
MHPPPDFSPAGMAMGAHTPTEPDAGTCAKGDRPEEKDLLPVCPAIRVHSLGQLHAALGAAAALGLAVQIESPAACAITLGAVWFTALLAEGHAAYPEVRILPVLDCGDEPGRVLGALRLGLPVLRFNGPAETTARLAALARHQGAWLLGPAERVLDLATIVDRQQESTCRQWLSLELTSGSVLTPAILTGDLSGP